LEVARQLRRRRRLARALEAREQDHGRGTRVHRELGGVAAEGGDELLVHDLDDLLCGAQALRNLRAIRAFLDASDARPHDAHVDVGLEQREADLARDVVDVLLGELAASAQPLEDSVEAVGQGIEHRRRPYSTRAAANSDGSNATRSSAPSPRPTSFTGTPNSA